MAPIKRIAQVYSRLALLAVTVLVSSNIEAALQGPVFPPPSGTYNFSQVGAPGDIGHTPGETWYFSAISLASSDILYWGAVNGGIALSMVSSSYSGPEIMTYAPGLSNLTNGLAVWQGQTTIILLPGNPTPVYTLFTLSVSNQLGPVALSLTNALAIGLPPNVGGVVRVASSNLAFQATLHFLDSFSPGGPFIPALDFFNSNPHIAGTAYSSFSAGFYYDAPPVLVVNGPLTVPRGGSATIPTALLQATSAGSSPSQLTYTVAPGGAGGPPHQGLLLLNGSPLTTASTFRQSDIDAGHLSYQNDNSCAVSDDFEFNITDADGGVTPTGTYTTFTFPINIIQPHFPPIANNQSFNVGLGSSYNGLLTASNQNCNPVTFTYRISSLPAKGTVILTDTNTGAFTYTAALSQSGADSFAFQVNDGTADAAVPGQVSINIVAMPPISYPGAGTNMENHVFAGSFSAVDPNLPPSPLGFTILTNGNLGVAVLTDTNTGAFTYTPAPNAFGVDTLTFQAALGTNLSQPATFTIFTRPTFDPGHLLIPDAGNLDVVELDPVNGYHFPITASNLLHGPRSVAIEPSGSILVGDPVAGIVRVNHDTGAQTPFASPTNFTGMAGPVSIVVHPNGRILVADLTSRIQSFDPVSGVSSNLSSGGPLTNAFGLAVAANGDLYVTDAGALSGQAGKLIHVDPNDGSQTVVTNSFVLPSAISIDASNTIYLCDAGSFAGKSDGLFAVDAVTGSPTLVSSNLLQTPLGLVIDAHHQLIVDNNGGNTNVITVDPASGIALPLGPTPYSYLNQPFGLAVVRHTPSITITTLPGNNVQLSISCEPGRFVALRYSSDMRVWTPLTTLGAPSGSATFVEPASQTARLYRAYVY